MEKTGLHRYALTHFQIDIYYKYTATPHGNYKKSRKPYLKAMSSTIESLKISASSKKPSAYIDTMRKVGKITAPSELPKNYKQANYERNLVKNKFELFQILDMIYCRSFMSAKKVGRSSCERSKVHQKE